MASALLLYLASSAGDPTTEAEMEAIRIRMLEIAEQIAAAFERTGEARAKIWEGKERGIVRVYVSRELSRGRWQDMGHIEINPDGSITVCAGRRSSWVEKVARQAVA